MKQVLFLLVVLASSAAQAQRTTVVSAKSDFVRVKTPLNAAAPVGENLFAQPGWGVGRGKEGFFVKTPAYYEVQPSRPNAWCLIPVRHDLNGGDFDLRVTLLPGDDGRTPSAGLLLSADTSHIPQNSRYIALTINDSGQFVFEHVDQGTSQFLVKGGSSHVRPTAANELRLERRDFTIRAYVNGQVVANETFRRLGGKTVFVGVTTDEKARFSNLLISSKSRN